jgi:hypothetical protein
MRGILHSEPLAVHVNGGGEADGQLQTGERRLGGLVPLYGARKLLNVPRR